MDAKAILRRACRLKGISAHDLAEILKIAPRTLRWHIINGRWSSEQKEKIRETLDIDTKIIQPNRKSTRSWEKKRKQKHRKKYFNATINKFIVRD